MLKCTSMLTCLVAGLLLCFGCGGEKKVVEKDLGPTETVTHVAQSMSSGDTEQLWASLPKSYRSDINGSLQLIGQKMPAEVWDKSFELVGRLGQLLKDKKAILLDMAKKDNASAALPVDPGQALDLISGVLTKIAQSDVASVNKLKSIDLAKVAGTTGKEIYNMVYNSPVFKAAMAQDKKAANLSENLKKVKAELISEKGNIAKVKITVPGEKKPEEIEMKKVEGKWIPKEMADQFTKEIARFKKDLSSGLDNVAKQKQSIVASIKTVETIIASLEKAKTAEELKKAIESPMVMGLVPMLMGSMMGPRQ